MMDAQEIAAALTTVLPARLHPQIHALARVLADALAGQTATITNAALLPLIEVLQGKTLDGCSGSISVGNIDGQGIAVGHGAASITIPIAEDLINAQYAQGFINHPRDPVSQTFNNYINNYQALPPRPVTPTAIDAALARVAALPADPPAPTHCLEVPHALRFSANDRFVGREADLRAIAHQLQQGQTTVIVTAGIGGVGKTSLANEVEVTFRKSYEPLAPDERINRLARALLARAAHFAPGEPIPRTLLMSSLAEDTAPDAELDREDALQRLLALGLLEPVTASPTANPQSQVRLHRLLVDFVQMTMPDDAAQAAVEQAMLNVPQEQVDQGRSEQLMALLPHLRHITEVALKRGDERAAMLANNLGYCLDILADYATAHSLFEHALAIDEVVYGPQHPVTAQSLNNLAMVLHSQGDYTAARSLHERALAIREQTLGSQHPDTAQSLNCLAGLLHSQGDYTAARALCERALAISEQVFGLQHPITARFLNNLAGLLKTQGNYATAYPLYERALAICEQTLGPQHPDTARALHNLAALRHTEGDYAAAYPLYKRALAIREQVLGPQHPDTAETLNNLGEWLRAQRNYAAAHLLYERALAINEQVFGPQHPVTATALNNLAILCYDEGNIAEAAHMMRRALAIWVSVLGTAHPDTQTAQDSLTKIEAKLRETSGT